MYCVYLTVYKGNKMPPFYLGSSSVEKVKNGYHGSVTSKKYRKIWNEELIYNSHLFQSKIVYVHANRKEAYYKECKLQKQLNVVKNPLYINQALAAKNPFKGAINSGKDNPFYGKKHTKETKLKMSKPKLTKKRISKRKFSENHKRNLSLSKIGKPLSEKHKSILSFAHMKERNHFYGKQHTEMSKKKQSDAMVGKIRITNGYLTKTINPSNGIPEGWRRGMK